MCRICIIPLVIILISFSGCSITEHNNPINIEELDISKEFIVPKGLDFKRIINIGQELGKILGRDQGPNAFAYSIS